MSKIIAVTGATGAQGGSVAYKLLETGQWHVRAITRNASSNAAKALANAGAEVVEANTDDEESLVRAFQSAHAVYAVTNFWEPLFTGASQAEAGEKELTQGKNLARAAARTLSLQHYLWSTLRSSSGIAGGKIAVPHWDYKAKVDNFINSELPELAAKTTFVMMAWYPSNMVDMPIMKPMPWPGTGKYILVQPCSGDTLLASTGDMKVSPGIWVRQILANPQKTKGKYVMVETEELAFKDVLKIWTEVSGQEAFFMEVSPEEFVQMWGIAGAELVAQLKLNEAMRGWHEARGPNPVTAADIGIKDDEVVGTKQAFENLKDRLL